MERSGRTHRVSLLPLWALALGCLDIAGLKGGSYVMAESTDIVKVSAVTGGDAALPCDTRTLSTDLLLLVVWYKDNVPMYSFDSRVKGPGSHWVDDILDGRVRWHATSPSTLRIHDVIPTDRALYRCRVDFKVSPTSNQKVLLDVIELPERPKIFDEYNKEVVAVAGPYVEDTSLKLSCVVSGGRPMPRLRWWRNDKIINTLAPLNDNSRISVLELFISRLSRDYFEAVYTCTADNTALVPPTRVNVQLHLYLKPLSVEIIPREQPLVVDQRADLSCRAVGARPPAIITWWLGHVQMDTAVQRDSDDRNETTSVLRWTPRIEQYGKTLTCRASHAILEHASIETTIKLNIHYSPIVELQLGSSMNPNDIEEGDDVYFNCIVNSNPPPYKVVWEHDDQIMTHNQRAGVIAGSAHLALQRVSRQQAGKYTCTASNVEGDGKSNPVDLDILYKPTCKETGILIVGAAINEPTKITCEVEAFPNPTNFVWTLNNSLGTSEIDSRDAKISRGKSVLSFTPSTDTDYGTVACRASNLAGQQLEPCLFKLLPAVRPDRPYDCYTYNITETSTTLKCSAGYDGGLQNKFFVEAWESRKIVVNKTSASPDWKLEGMKPGKTYKLFIYAYNRRGRSEPGVLRVHTLSRLALLKETSTSNGGGYLNWILGVILGVAGTLVVMMLLAMLAKKRRHQPVQNADPPQAVKTYKGSDHSENHSPEQPDDMNPDLIPLGKELNYLRETERLPEPPPYQSVMSPLVGLSKSAHSLHYHELRSTAHTPSTIETQSIGMLSEDRRSLASGTLSRKREIVTTRTPLLANTRESCV